VNSMGTNSLVAFGYLETGRLGVNVARNRGLERAGGEIVLFLDDDMILDNDSFVAEHVAYHRTHATAVAVGGPYRLMDNSSNWDFNYHNIAHDWLKRQSTYDSGTTQLLGGNISLKRAALIAHSWSFDEAISFGGAESGLCSRIASAGYRLLFFEDLEIGHAPQLTARSFMRKAFLQGAGARWRSDHIPSPPFTYVNSHLPERTQRLRSQKIAIALYRLFFDFGWKKNPYADSIKLTAPTSLSPLSFLFFVIGRLKASEKIRALNRSIYAALRSAWINGETVRRNAKPR
jgi:GT2 family glycosyltransferase